MEVIKGVLSNSSDVVIHEFNFGNDRKYNGALIYIDNMVNKAEIHKNILQPLMYETLFVTQRI